MVCSLNQRIVSSDPRSRILLNLRAKIRNLPWAVRGRKTTLIYKATLWCIWSQSTLSPRGTQSNPSPSPWDIKLISPKCLKFRHHYCSQYCSASKIGMVTQLPRTNSFASSSTATKSPHTGWDSFDTVKFSQNQPAKTTSVPTLASRPPKARPATVPLDSNQGRTFIPVWTWMNAWTTPAHRSVGTLRARFCARVTEDML